MSFNRDDPSTWPCFRPLIIAHDVGRSRDRSTAVVGGNGPFEPRLLGILDLQELPQGLYGSARASKLAEVDRHYNSNALIVADLSNDPSYAEVLYETFGPRVIGLQISRHGDGLRAARPRADHPGHSKLTVGEPSYKHRRMPFADYGLVPALLLLSFLGGLRRNLATNRGVLGRNPVRRLAMGDAARVGGGIARPPTQ